MTFEADKNAERSAASHFKQALAKFRSGDMRGGLDDLEAAIRLNPLRWEYFWTRGAFNFRRRVYPLAESDLTKAIELCPEAKQAAKIYQRRMFCYGRLERYDGVIQDATWLIEHGFESEYLYWWRGWARYWMGDDVDSAIADYSRTIEFSPNSWFNRVNRITLYYRAERYAQALDDLEYALSLALREAHLSKASLHIVYRFRALIFYRLGDFEKSLNEYNLGQIVSGFSTFLSVESYLDSIKASAEVFYSGMPSRPYERFELNPALAEPPKLE